MIAEFLVRVRLKNLMLQITMRSSVITYQLLAVSIGSTTNKNGNNMVHNRERYEEKKIIKESLDILNFLMCMAIICHDYNHFLFFGIINNNILIFKL